MVNSKKFKNSAIPSKNLEDFGVPSIKGDIDVYIEKLHTGIECKIWLAESKATDEQMMSYTNSVLKKLEKYQKVGIKHLLVITNLDKDDSEEMLNRLSKKLGNVSLKIISNSIDELDRMINDQIEKLNQFNHK